MQLKVSVQSDPAGEAGAAWRQVRFVGGGALLVEDPDLHGRIEQDRGLAAVAIGGADPTEALDYFLRLVLVELAYRQGGTFFHAAGVLCDGRACLFFGPSGSGKSTVASLAGRRRVLNDDLVLLMPAGQGWQVHATPFGMRDPRPGEGPLAALFGLEQARRVSVRPMSPAQALAEVVASIPVLPADPGRAPGLLSQAARLLAGVPAYRLRFRPDPTFWPAVEHVL